MQFHGRLSKCRTSLHWFLIALTGVGIFAGHPLVAAAQASAVPSDPAELLMLAAKSNGLLGDGMHPWHLKVSYYDLGQQGKVTGQETIEEFWAAANKYRVTYSGAGYLQTTYWTDKGIFRTGETNPPPFFVAAMREQLVEPLPDPIYLQHEAFDVKELSGGSIKLNCLSLKPARAVLAYAPLVGSTYCLEAGTTNLRISMLAQGGNQFLRNGITNFQDRSIPTDLKIMFSGKPVATATVDTLEALGSFPDSDFVPPSGAVPVPRRVTISGGVAQGFLEKKVAPEFPESARAAGISGVVVVRSIIDTHGRIVDVRPVLGPPELRKAASDAVFKWVYRPYLLNGEPVEVETTMNVIFQLRN